MGFSKILLFVSIVVLISIVLVGCNLGEFFGLSTPSPTPTPTPTFTPTPTPSPTPTPTPTPCTGCGCGV